MFQLQIILKVILFRLRMPIKCLKGTGLSAHIMTSLMPSLGLLDASCPPTILDSVGGSHSEHPMSETSPDAEEGQFSLLVEEKNYFHFIKPLDVDQGLSTEDGFCSTEEAGTSQVPSAQVGREGIFS